MSRYLTTPIRRLGAVALVPLFFAAVWSTVYYIFNFSAENASIFTVCFPLMLWIGFVLFVGLVSVIDWIIRGDN